MQNKDIENEIMDNLLLDIRECKYEFDDKMPSDNKLAEKYGVPRLKVRRVYEKLEQMGYIYSLQGRGRFLKRRGKYIELVLSGEESFTKKMLDAGYNLITKNVYCNRIPYNGYIFDQLKVDKSVPVYKIGRLRIVDGEPLAIHVSYVATNVFPNISADGKEITSMFNYYSKNGYYNYKANETSLEIAYSTSKERELLQCGELVPLIKLKTNCIDTEKNRILEYTETIYRGDKFVYKI